MTLDQSRLVMLRMFTEAERAEIVGGMLATTERLLTSIAGLIEAGDLSHAAEDAHRGRNEALVVGAAELGDAFAALEDAGRKAHSILARAALGRLQALWPPTRTAVRRLLAESQQGVQSGDGLGTID